MECPNCGASSSDDALFCATCGNPLAAPPPEPSAEAPAARVDDWGQFGADPTAAQPGPGWVAAPQAPDYVTQTVPSESYVPPPVAYGEVPPPPTGGYYGGPRPNIPNHLVWAILTALFCCLPAGVVSIVYAAQVNGKIEKGDYAGAQRYSTNARTWAIVSAALSVVYVAIILMFVLSVSVSGS
jgi:hypothetical protein